MNFNSFNESLINRSENWMDYPSKSISVKIQPHYQPNEYVIYNIDSFIKKIEILSEKYYLVHNCAEIYRKEINDTQLTQGIFHSPISLRFRKKYTHHIKFRISDSLYNEPDATSYGTYPGDIPRDIKHQIIKEVSSSFGKASITSDDFPERGYILFDILISR